MKKFVFIVALLVSGSATAGQPSDASIRELIDITGSKQMFDAMGGQADQMIAGFMDKALQGRPVPDSAKAPLEKARGRMAALLRKALSWERSEAGVLRIYKEVFSQEEVDAMIVFYKSEAGKSMTAKMPEVMQRSMSEVQAQMAEILPEMDAISNDMVNEINANRSQ